MRRLVVPFLLASLGCSGSGSATPPQADAADPTDGAASSIRTCPRKPKSTAIPDACNGAAALCDRTFDGVTFAMTHNAMSNADDGWAAPNQTHGIARQLQDGVRGLMLDTHYYDAEYGHTADAPLPSVPAIDQAYLCHGTCALGKRRLLEGLCDVVDFLDQNRGEVVSIIFESNVSPAHTAEVVKAAGLLEYVYAWPGGAWPTLREMIANDTRLVVFTESDGGEPPWYHPAWSVIRDTPYSFSKASEFSCALNRGSADDPLFLLNHWILDPLANPDRAIEVNAKDVLLARAEECSTAAGRKPTFVGVDFYELGDLFAVVRTLNGL